MIHYHGTPITPRAQLLRMAGRHFCVSYASPQDLKTCLDIGQSIMFDNGAFSAYTKGFSLDVEGYYKWLEGSLVHPHFAVIPDVIGGTVDEQNKLIDSWPFLWTLGAPVWHLNEPIEQLLNLINQGWPKICLGSSGEFWKVGDAKWCGRMDYAFNAMVRTYTQLPWVHGLRMLGQCENEWPLASADSTNVAQNHHRTGCAECMAGGLDARQPSPKWAEREIQDALF